MDKKKVTVAVADDEPIILIDLEEMLDHLGYEVVGTAADGFEIIEICREKKPDVVLLDVEMPLVDGFAAASCIMEEKIVETVVMVTAYSSKEFITQAKEVGAAGYIVKPVDERIIVPTIEIAQARRRDIIKLQKEIVKTKEYIEDRKIIEKAKGLLMQKKSLSENDAYELIRRISKDKCMSMRRVSEIFLRGKK